MSKYLYEYKIIRALDGRMGVFFIEATVSRSHLDAMPLAFEIKLDVPSLA